MQRLFVDPGDLPPGGVQHLVVPAQPVPLHPPAIAVEGVGGAKEGELPLDLADAALPQIEGEAGEKGEYLLLDLPQIPVLGVVNF